MAHTVVRLGSKPLPAKPSSRPWQFGFEERLNWVALAVHSPVRSRSGVLSGTSKASANITRVN